MKTGEPQNGHCHGDVSGLGLRVGHLPERRSPSFDRQVFRSTLARTGDAQETCLASNISKEATKAHAQADMGTHTKGEG